MLRKTLVTTVVSFGILICGSAHAAGPDMKEGKWEITTTTEMSGAAVPPGMPTPFGQRPMTLTRCYTKQDLENREKMLESAGTDKDCKMDEWKAAENKRTFKMSCTGKRTGTGTGEFTYYGTSYDGVIKMTMQDARRGNMEMTKKIQGKRIGDC